MTNRTTLAGLLAFGLLLSGCSKQAPAPVPAADDGETTPPVAAQPEPHAPTYDRAAMAAGMMSLIDTAPQCQTFRDQLEAAGKTPADQPQSVEPSSIVAKANEAGCAKK
jgi:PBP1b-binding outer membrane lipoprotein LpoB